MRIVGSVIALFVVACASAGKRVGDCTPVAVEQRGGVAEVYRSCAVDVAAMPEEGGARPIYTPPRPDFCARVDLEMVVDTAGLVVLSSVNVKRSTDRGLLDVVNALLPSLRYTPARKGSTAVAQLVEYGIAIAGTGASTPVSGLNDASTRRRPRPQC